MKRLITTVKVLLIVAMAVFIVAVAALWSRVRDRGEDQAIRVSDVSADGTKKGHTFNLESDRDNLSVWVYGGSDRGEPSSERAEGTGGDSNGWYVTHSDDSRDERQGATVSGLWKAGDVSRSGEFMVCLPHLFWAISAGTLACMLLRNVLAADARGGGRGHRLRTLLANSVAWASPRRVVLVAPVVLAVAVWARSAGREDVLLWDRDIDSGVTSRGEEFHLISNGFGIKLWASSFRCLSEAATDEHFHSHWRELYDAGNPDARWDNPAYAERFTFQFNRDVRPDLKRSELAVLFPHWLSVTAAAAPLGLALLTRGPRWLRRRSRKNRGLCTQCGYDIRGLTRCPECGTERGKNRVGVRPIRPTE